MHDPFAEYGLAEPFIPSSFDCFPGMHLAGVDEVGRGPLVGAVVTAAVVLDPARPVPVQPLHGVQEFRHQLRHFPTPAARQHRQ